MMRIYIQKMQTALHEPSIYDAAIHALMKRGLPGRSRSFTKRLFTALRTECQRRGCMAYRIP